MPPVRDQWLILENDICKLLLLVFELCQQFLNIGLVRFQWLELVTNIVASFSVFIFLSNIQGFDRRQLVDIFEVWFRTIFLLRNVVRKAIALLALATHVAKNGLGVNKLWILQVLLDGALKLRKASLLINLPLLPGYH